MPSETLACQPIVFWRVAFMWMNDRDSIYDYDSLLVNKEVYRWRSKAYTTPKHLSLFLRYYLVPIETLWANDSFDTRISKPLCQLSSLLIYCRITCKSFAVLLNFKGKKLYFHYSTGQFQGGWRTIIQRKTYKWFCDILVE